MAKKQTIANGTEVKFLGYDDETQAGDLKKGSTLKIIGYDAEQDTYNVKDEHGTADSLYVEEFSVLESKPAKSGKAATKTAPTKKATKTKTAPVEEVADEEVSDEETEEVEEEEIEEEEVEEEEVVETPAPATKTAKTSKTAAKTAAKPETKTTKTAKTAVKEEVEEVPLPKFKKTASVAKLLKEHEDILTAASVVADEKERTVFTLGGVLALIKREDSFLSIMSDQLDDEGNQLPFYSPGLKGFDAYVFDELGIAPRTANYYVQIYEKFSQVTTEAKLAKIGWTKLRQLLPLQLTEDNVDEWLEIAKEDSVVALAEKVKTELVNSGEETHGNTNTAVMKSFKLVVHEDQATMIEEAFAAAREVLGADATHSQCFVHIAQEWLSLGTEESE